MKSPFLTILNNFLLSLVVRHLFLIANFVTTSKAHVTTSKAIVPSSGIALYARNRLRWFHEAFPDRCPRPLKGDAVPDAKAEFQATAQVGNQTESGAKSDGLQPEHGGQRYFSLFNMFNRAGNWKQEQSQ